MPRPNTATMTLAAGLKRLHALKAFQKKDARIAPDFRELLKLLEDKL